jgi:hypothetical protein
MANSVLNYIINVIKKGSGDKETVTAMQSVKSVMTGVGIAAGVATTAYVAYDRVIGEATKKTVSYAAEVRKLGSITNQSEEETSKLIQTMDDFKISADQITIASKAMAKQGLSPTVETMAKLADQFVKLNSGEERATFLTKNFGKAGLDMAEAMLTGGDAIRRVSESVNKGLILTKQQVQAARNYEIAQDDLNDTMEAYSVVIGNKVIPLQTRIIDGLVKSIDKTSGFNRNLLIAIRNLEKMPIDSATQSYMAWAKAVEEKNKADKIAETEAETHLATLQQITAYGKDYSDSLVSVTDLEKQLADARRRGYSDSGSKIREIKAALMEAKDASRDATAAMVYDLMQVQMAAEGITDPKAFLDLQLALGLISSAAYDAALKALMLGDALRNIPTDVRSTVSVFYAQYGYMPDFADKTKVVSAITAAGGANQITGSTKGKNKISGAIGDAVGGPLKFGGLTWVGEHGRELVGPDGMVYSNAQSRRLAALGVVPVRGFAQGGDVFTSGGNIPPVKTGLAALVASGNLSASHISSVLSGVKSGGGSSSSAAASSQAVAVTAQAAQVNVAAAQSVVASSQSIQESNVKTANATQMQTAMSAIQNNAILSELQGLRNDIKTILPKAIADGYQKVI